MEEKVIVSFTSWKGKLCYNISPTIISLCEQTRTPDKVYLNLSLEEFDNDKNTIPDYLVELEKAYSPVFTINWVEGENTKCFKKFLPILKYHQNDIIITADDDIAYPEFYVNDMVESFLIDPTRPITTTYHCYGGVMFMYGGASLYKAEFLKGYENLLTSEIIHTYEDDWFYSYVLLLNEIRPRLAKESVLHNPYVYNYYIGENQMADLQMYNTQHTKEILDNMLIGLGHTYDELAMKIYKKYKNSV